MSCEMKRVCVNGRELQYPQGTTYEDIARDFQEEYEDDIVLVLANERLRELRWFLKDDCEIKFLTTGDVLGQNAYRRSMSMMMVKAIHDICEHSGDVKVRIHFSLGEGLYCTVEGTEVDQQFLDRVSARMKELVEADIPIRKRSVETDEAIQLFKNHKMYSKEKLFQYRRVSKVNVYSINEFEDYYYGYMVPRTSILKYFELHLYDEGFVLHMPSITHPKEIGPFLPANRLFQVLKESTKCGDMQGIETIGDLNEMITERDVSEMILVQEAIQEKKIASIAETIAGNSNIKFVLVAGPSSSGKTTFSHRLSIQLKANGLTPHPIAVDNFFVEREETPRDENGELNFECLETVDVGLFNKCMKKLLAGEEVVLPTFNFKTGHKEYLGKPKKLGENDVLVIEGIHCLNPKMTLELPDENKYKVYISALTQLNIDEHNRIPTTDGRLIRRIIRDARTRGTTAKATIAMWPSVRRGEESYIFPYQEEADVAVNSSMLYELAVLKQYVEPLLYGIPRDCPEYLEAKRLLKFMDYFVGISSDTVPANSLIREFIGGGCFPV